MGIGSGRSSGSQGARRARSPGKTLNHPCTKRVRARRGAQSVCENGADLAEKSPLFGVWAGRLQETTSSSPFKNGRNRKLAVSSGNTPSFDARSEMSAFPNRPAQSRIFRIVPLSVFHPCSLLAIRRNACSPKLMGSAFRASDARRLDAPPPHQFLPFAIYAHLGIEDLRGAVEKLEPVSKRRANRGA